MIIFDRNTKELEIPAGLGNLEINVESRCEGVTSIDGQTGPVTLKKINGNELVGSGDIQIGAKTYVLNLMSTEEKVALYNELQQYAVSGVTRVSEDFPEEDYNFLWYLNGSYDAGGGFAKLRFSALRHDNGSEFFQGIRDGYVGRNFKYISVILKEDGTLAGSEGFPCVYTINGQKGELNLKTINGNSLLGTGDIEISGTTLPIASADTLGGVKIGEGISIDENGVISTSGGSGGVTSGEVQTMIDSALTDYATTAVTDELSTAVNGKMAKQTKGSTVKPIYSTAGTLAECRVSNVTNQRYNSVTITDNGGVTHAGKAIAFHSATTDSSATTQLGKLPTKGGFTVYYPNDGTDYTVSNNQHFIVDSDDLVHIKKITQADYDALVLAGTVDEHTLYLVI